MTQIINTEFKETGIVQLLMKQRDIPYNASLGVDEILRTFPHSTTRKTAYCMYMLGYIEGKRAERARKQKRGVVK